MTVVRADLHGRRRCRVRRRRRTSRIIARREREAGQQAVQLQGLSQGQAKALEAEHRAEAGRHSSRFRKLTMKLSLFTLTFGLVRARAIAGTAFAQARPERPDRGLFGSGHNRPGRRGPDSQRLRRRRLRHERAGERGAMRVSSAGRRTNAVPGWSYALLSGALSYALNKQRFGLAASGSSSNRVYPTLSKNLIRATAAGLAASWRPSTRTRLSANQTFSYQPFSLYSLFPEFQQLPLGAGVRARSRLQHAAARLLHLQHDSDRLAAAVERAPQSPPTTRSR